MIAARIETPAKINLGLEIPGRRPDGYHEIVTILCMLELCDDLVVVPDPARSGTALDGVTPEDNLIAKALRAFEQRTGEDIAFGWHLTKRIPAAAGLGGASGNAAGALLAANLLASRPLPGEELVAIANSLGSDIAFFLGTPTALATGTGTTLTSLPTPDLDVLLVVPADALANKTAAMYGALREGDFSNGATVRQSADMLHASSDSIPDLANAFRRALVDLVPGAAAIDRALEQDCEAPWGVTGAGPAFCILAPLNEHDALKLRLGASLPNDVTFLSTSTRSTPLQPVRVPWNVST